MSLISIMIIFKSWKSRKQVVGRFYIFSNCNKKFNNSVFLSTLLTLYVLVVEQESKHQKS